MRVKELKRELESLDVSTRNALEKEELVQRLFVARTSGSGSGGEGEDDSERSKKKKKKKKRRHYEDDDGDEVVARGSGSTINDGSAETTRETTENTSSGSKDTAETASEYDENLRSVDSYDRWTITAPFIYRELAASKSVAAENAKDIFIRPSQGKFAAINVRLENSSSFIEWTLLVDTACSGLVLSPDAVACANEQCPGIVEVASDVGATMTMAGSSQGAAVARWNSRTKMTVQGVEINHANVAACQDIGALPAGLDGILGLSFLDQFACVDFDFVNNELRLERSNPDPRIPNDNDIVAQGPLRLTRLRIYTADVTLDGRGPVKMLVDTGAASTFLNWRGVADMRLSSSSPQIAPIREQIGAMGADNRALQLTHRFRLKRRWNTVAENTAVGDRCPGIGLPDDRYSDIDISDLPVLETLKGDGVGGILGADLFIMCDVVRFCGLNGGSPRMILMKR